MLHKKKKKIRRNHSVRNMYNMLPKCMQIRDLIKICSLLIKMNSSDLKCVN